MLSPASENTTITADQVRSTPRLIQNTDGSYTVDKETAPSSITSTSHWWSIDLWCTTSGTQMPSQMTGSFVAVSNTIGNLNGAQNDQILYLPLNVAYGTSSSNFVWFQFCVYFMAGGSVQWSIWDLPNGANGRSNTINLTYTPGHTYNFALTTSGTNTVTFTIEDMNTLQSNTVNSWVNGNNQPITVPGLTMLYWPNGAFSPASCVEGYTSNSQLTNVPYFQTYTGYGETTHYHSDSAGIPSGISTGIWTAGTNYYYWNMLSQYSVSSISGTTNYGAGNANSANNLIGNQDGAYANLWGGNPGDGGNIVGVMNAASGGNIYIYGYSTSGYYSDLYVYVSTDNQHWTQIGNALRITQSTPYWISIGSYMGDFSYIAVAGYDTGYSVNLHLDAVKVGL